MPAWRPLFAQAESQADTVSPGLAARTRAALADLEQAWPRGTARGRDPTPICSSTTCSSSARGVSGLIDFYFACNDMLAYDLAICLNAWCFEAERVLQRHQEPGL